MGGGGGSSGYFRSPSQTAEEVRKVEAGLASERFRTELSDYLRDKLRQFNNRDTHNVRKRLDDAAAALEGILSERIDLSFGGSVAKHTYVDGLSDVDCLMVLNGTDLEKAGPQTAIKTVERTLADRFSGKADVSSGKLAVTVKFKDGMEVQLLPAVTTDDGVKIASSRQSGRWSEVRPKAFQEALTKRNAECGGQMVPTVKLAKGVLGQLPEAQQLSGYHVESLGIDAFRGYTGTRTPAAMLAHFFGKAKERVLRPMTDSTGQSVHVDSYLGAAGSRDRQAAGHLLGRIEKRLLNASASGSVAAWKALFGDDA